MVGQADQPAAPGATAPSGSENGLSRLLLTALLSAATGTVATVALLSKWIKTAAPPELYYEANDENLRLLLAVPLLWRSYIPNVFAWNGHIASLFGYVKLPSWSHRRADVEVITPNLCPTLRLTSPTPCIVVVMVTLSPSTASPKVHATFSLSHGPQPLHRSSRCQMEARFLSSGAPLRRRIRRRYSCSQASLPRL
jgi:hypothetical protein